MIQYNNLMDMAVIDCCKLFGSDDAEHQLIHWKNIADDEDSFRSALLVALAMRRKDWNAYWLEMKRYRDFSVAHHDPQRAEIANYPVLDTALESALFYFEYVQREMQKFGITLQPANIQTYETDYRAKYLKVARIALDQRRICQRTSGHEPTLGALRRDAHSIQERAATCATVICRRCYDGHRPPQCSRLLGACGARGGFVYHGLHAKPQRTCSRTNMKADSS